VVAGWTGSRDLPDVPERSFRDQFEDGGDV
jgi:hypothetical protein